MKIIKPICLLLTSLLILVVAKPTLAIEAVASIKHIKGAVDVNRDQKTISARTGLILHDQDLIVTYRKSKVTIIFRDGSEIRLFANTKFLIERSEETSHGPRRFLNNFKLKLGSFWGKFSKNQQQTVIKTPTATAGIKGTTVALSERNGKFNVSLSSGLVEVKNEMETLDLTPGKRVRNITANSTIRDKVEELPYQIHIVPDQNKLDIPQRGKEKEIFFTVQLISKITNKNVQRSGDIYISLETDKIIFPQNLALNPRGYARVRAVVKPFEQKDYKNGVIEIFALMDGEEFMDTGAGRTVLTYDPPSRKRKTLKIDASSGDIQ